MMINKPHSINDHFLCSRVYKIYLITDYLNQINISKLSTYFLALASKSTSFYLKSPFMLKQTLPQNTLFFQTIFNLLPSACFINNSNKNLQTTFEKTYYLKFNSHGNVEAWSLRMRWGTNFKTSLLVVLELQLSTFPWEIYTCVIAS